jgi:hypothetical protein
MGMIFVGRRLTPEQLDLLEADPSAVSELLDDEQEPLELDLDKAWHGIHFLLTGTAWSTSEGAGEAVLGGDPIGEDNGYGPARLLSADRVQLVAGQLSDLDVDTMRARFDPAALMDADIYPGIWGEGDVFDTYLAPSLVALREFYLAAAQQSQAVLLALT